MLTYYSFCPPKIERGWAKLASTYSDGKYRHSLNEEFFSDLRISSAERTVCYIAKMSQELSGLKVNVHGLYTWIDNYWVYSGEDEEIETPFISINGSFDAAAEFNNGHWQASEGCGPEENILCTGDFARPTTAIFRVSDIGRFNIRVNGRSVYDRTFNLVPYMNNTETSIGADESYYATGNTFIGDVLVYDKFLTNEECSLVEDFLHSKFAS